MLKILFSLFPFLLEILGEVFGTVNPFCIQFDIRKGIVFWAFIVLFGLAFIFAFFCQRLGLEVIELHKAQNTISKKNDELIETISRYQHNEAAKDAEINTYKTIVTNRLYCSCEARK